jgi:hypothetical protein
MYIGVQFTYILYMCINILSFHMHALMFHVSTKDDKLAVPLDEE